LREREKGRPVVERSRNDDGAKGRDKRNERIKELKN